MTRKELHTEFCDILKTKNKRKNIDSVTARLRQLVKKTEEFAEIHPGFEDAMGVAAYESTFLEEAGRLVEAREAMERHLEAVWKVARWVSRAAATSGAVLAEMYYEAGEFDKGEEHLRKAMAALALCPESNTLVTHAMRCADCADMEKQGQTIPDHWKSAFKPGSRWRPKRKPKSATKHVGKTVRRPQRRDRAEAERAESPLLYHGPNLNDFAPHM